MVHRPIQTIGDVHLVKVLFHMVVRKEGVQGPLAALQNCRSCFLSHGTYKIQRAWSSATQHPACARCHLSPGLLPHDEIKEMMIQSQSGSYAFFFFFLMATTLLAMLIKTTWRGFSSRHLHQLIFSHSANSSISCSVMSDSLRPHGL